AISNAPKVACMCMCSQNISIPLETTTFSGKPGSHENSMQICGGKMEETFVASSTGEGMEVIDMAESEDSQLLGNAAVKDMLLDLAVSLNTASVMLFFLYNMNIYLCFMIAF
uniref:Uncharacterized protein n=1 Tax=Podarcis muralis TaxID=64176 RepID=A0A670JYY2_PODMU